MRCQKRLYRKPFKNVIFHFMDNREVPIHVYYTVI